eukprot:CAMPEP_0115111492 /NCGR_PEP_ID=MMETSP0227-20121206/40060_1 /TAXON_ID=89957 /ORGANISM="Polarella glacialis, Strain CCMP 1383" /LENGTH=185 /DNA_ID=CAMNT_0002510845 /DNA_START=66 /DNA_END=624 /DNA_ORIENTATION=+
MGNICPCSQQPAVDIFVEEETNIESKTASFEIWGPGRSVLGESTLAIMNESNLPGIVINILQEKEFIRGGSKFVLKAYPDRDDEIQNIMKTGKKDEEERRQAKEEQAKAEKEKAAADAQMAGELAAAQAKKAALDAQVAEDEAATRASKNEAERARAAVVAKKAEMEVQRKGEGGNGKGKGGQGG